MPPKYPEINPYVVPTITSIKTAHTAMNNEIRAPVHRRTHRSLPKVSVPNQCSKLGEILCKEVFKSSNFHDDNIGAKIANNTIIIIIISPITAPLFCAKISIASCHAGFAGATTSIEISCLSPTNSKSSGRNSISFNFVSIMNPPSLNEFLDQ